MKEERDENLGSRRSPSKSASADEIIPLSPQLLTNNLFVKIMFAK
jgi:hypothetical protein